MSVHLLLAAACALATAAPLLLLAKVLAMPEVRERFPSQGAGPGRNTRYAPTNWARSSRPKADEWARAVKVSNGKVN